MTNRASTAWHRERHLGHGYLAALTWASAFMVFYVHLNKISLTYSGLRPC